MTINFEQLGVSSNLAQQLQLNGITNPTPVQQQAIPIILKGKDVIAKAQTGTGKTFAFALPILQQIRTDKNQLQALILTPTRELAIQITNEVKKLASIVGASVLACYGGQDVVAQIKKLQNAPQIVVATPGRLLDHIRRGTINVGPLSFLVLDEADQMLHMGFLDDVEAIIMQTTKARQTLLFSATMPNQVRKLAEVYMNKPEHIDIQTQRVTLDNIKQQVIETTDRLKQDALIYMFETQKPFLSVIFCRTKLRAKKLTEALQEAGYWADELHGDLSQAKREQVMKKFRDMRLQMLIATDVAARGLDIEGVSHVYNYDIPLDAESYIHRIGRTGRAGQTGEAITFVTAKDMDKLQMIEKSIATRLPRTKLDSSHLFGRNTERSSTTREAKPKHEQDQFRASKTIKKEAKNAAKNRASEKSLISVDTKNKKVKSKSSPWEINQTDLELARGIKPEKRNARTSSRTRSEQRSSSRSTGRSGGRSGGRGKR